MASLQCFCDYQKDKLEVTVAEYILVQPSALLHVFTTTFVAVSLPFVGGTVSLGGLFVDMCPHMENQPPAVFHAIMGCVFSGTRLELKLSNLITQKGD